MNPGIPVFPGPSNDPDGPLVAAALGGDGRAFGRLVERLRDRVYRFILRKVNNVQDAEDLTQDTFLEIYAKLGNYRGASRFSTWVIGVALNLSRNHVTRRPERRYRMESTDELGDMTDNSAGPHEQARSHAFATAVTSAMDTLGEEAREALQLVTLEELDYQEAAEIAGIPVNTMKTRVYRARKALREAMHTAGQEDFLDP
ncbi:RNA polymerase sigma factor [Magnetospira sp. QH-2]|uniref:RNA polymerase sigma factor n=1 Tax=Magnetospira sp. (strain QH-2) TaxID=1288970 RepID=UPI0003E81BAC|nr:RNA polymerase sigma factor [Magnetospira sp. QH-2]CCQ75564.1 putative RNA polymerase sigma factor [Magnetospira sp. QH-2]